MFVGVDKLLKAYPKTQILAGATHSVAPARIWVFVIRIGTEWQPSYFTPDHSTLPSSHPPHPHSLPGTLVKVSERTVWIKGQIRAYWISTNNFAVLD